VHMIRKTFEHELQQVKDEILILGSMVEQAVLDAMESLKKRDIKASKMIYEQDRIINEKRFAIENQCMILIATQQPMARDLRLLASMLDVASELERMGDYAKGIATINIRMGDQPLLKPLIDLPRMASKGADMLHRALTAFMTDDVEAALAIPAEDDEVDALYDQIYRELMTFVIADPKVIERANMLLWAAHNMERMADRVTNICERTVFVVTGEIKEIQTTSTPKEMK
jgi:phosphate transport system protein